MTRCLECDAELDVDDVFSRRCRTPAARPELATALGPAPTEEYDAADIQRALEGTLAPKIRVLRVSSPGGMGIVFLGRDVVLKRLVAITVLAPHLARNPKLVTRFAREAESMAQISHPHVVKIYEVGSLAYASTCFFIMQFVEGETLEDAFPANRPATVPAVRQIAGAIAAALSATHSFGIVHRDIKASNVMRWV